MLIATWNVNSLRARFEHLQRWLEQTQPDIVLLQETKVSDGQFPLMELQALDYRAAFIGEKSYNGVAILARGAAPADVLTALPGEEDDRQARYIEATVNGLRVASIYVPNGSAVGSDKFAYKLRFFARLRAHLAARVEQEAGPFVLGGDYNVAPHGVDVYDPARLEGTVCFHPDERRAFRSLLHQGYYDAWRTTHPSQQGFSWWHYQAAAYQADHGLRIDHLLLNPCALDHLHSAWIDKAPRGWAQPSDHTPVCCRLRWGAEAPADASDGPGDDAATSAVNGDAGASAARGQQGPPALPSETDDDPPF